VVNPPGPAGGGRTCAGRARAASGRRVNLFLVFIGVALVISALISGAPIVFDRDSLDEIMLRAVIVVVSGLLGLAFLLEGVAGWLYELVG
jgi:hypothetical protein